MAGDWLKMRHDLVDDPAVIALARLEDVRDEMDAVGRLHKFWSWCDRQTSDGCLGSVPLAWVDGYVGVAGFGQTLVDEHWLTVNNGTLAIPKFDKHMSQCAKKRALDASRKQKSRSIASATSPEKVRTMSAPQTDKSVTREEKRREEKKTKKPPTPLELELPFPGETFKAAWTEFDEHRDGHRSKWTVLAAKKILTKLGAMTHDDAIAAINNSIESGWAGVFPPGGSRQSRSPSRVVGKPGKFDGIAKNVQTGTYATDVRGGAGEVGDAQTSAD